MKDQRRQRGSQSEQLAAHYLQSRGIKVLGRNLCCKAGELDLICLDGDVLAVIEVRQRGRQEFCSALHSVTWCKQRKIIRATRYFLQRQTAGRGLAVRFDVFAVEDRPDGAHRLHWAKDALRAT